MLLWQLSQLPVTLAWMGVDGLPAAARTLAPWQVLQPESTATLACSRPLAQVVTLPLWQPSQLSDAAAGRPCVGGCAAGFPSAGACWPSWQLAQRPALTTWLWFHAVGRQAVNDLWQLSQALAPVVGMC